MKKILFTSPIMEYPAAGGPQLRIENTVRVLCRLADVHIFSRTSPSQMGGQDALDFYNNLALNLEIAPSMQRTIWGRIRSKIDFLCGTLWNFKVDCWHLQHYIQKNNIEILWCGFGNISYPLIAEMRRCMPQLKIVCDTDSVWSRFVLRGLSVEKDNERRTAIETEGYAKEQEEKLFVDISDVTTAVSEEDASYYRSITTHPEKVHICSNVINLDTYATHHAPPPNFHVPAIFLGGSYGDVHSPMGWAAQWVVHEVMPIVWEQYPQAHLYLVGRGSDQYCTDLVGERVSATGKLPTVLPYLQNAAVSIVPLQFESGTRFKILESGACGIPIVSTSLGAEGIPVTHGQELLLADNPRDFAQAILLLLAEPDRGRQLATACHAMVERDYCLESLEREISRILEYLVLYD